MIRERTEKEERNWKSFYPPASGAENELSVLSSLIRRYCMQRNETEPSPDQVFLSEIGNIGPHAEDGKMAVCTSHLHELSGFQIYSNALAIMQP